MNDRDRGTPAVGLTGARHPSEGRSEGGDSPKRAKPRDYRDDILEALARAGRPLSLTDLRQRTGIRRDKLTERLRELAKLTYIEPEGADWTITEGGRRVLGLPREVRP